MNSGPFPSSMPPELARAAKPDFPRWRQMVTATGGCAQPVRLQGRRLTIDTTTGEVIDEYTTDNEPTGYLLTACGNRRASRCPACADVYRRDAYHLIFARLAGGKGIPDTISDHPRVFATLTAPSFGPVHTSREQGGRPRLCRPRRNSGTCQHGRPVGCTARHERGDPQLGTPLCPDCYDYMAAVLWNAHAGQLWKRFRTYTERALAAQARLRRAALRRQARLGYAKIAEYQARGLVHFHAVIRIDGPAGPEDTPPAWANVQQLEQAIRTAARNVAISTPDPHQSGRSLTLRWGNQLDVRPVHLADTGSGDAFEDAKVAGYIAKYATKGAEATSTTDRPIRSAYEVATLHIPDHPCRMIRACWALAARPEYADLCLRQWSHMLGYRGHFLTKPRRYSTTLSALRQARADHRAAEARQRHGQPEPVSGNVVNESQWRFAGSGYRQGEAIWADVARERVRLARAIDEDGNKR